MPLVHQFLIALRTLIEDDPEPYRAKRKRPNNDGKSHNRNKHATALVLSFRDLFTTGGLNALLDEMEMNSRPRRRNSRSSFSMSNRDRVTSVSVSRARVNTRVTAETQIAPYATPSILDPTEENVPLLLEETESTPCRDLVPSPAGGFFSSLVVIPKKNKTKPIDVTVPLNLNDENKTVETLRKVLKWSPRKQNLAKFAVPLPKEEEHVALAVVQNAVNIVKEEQQHKKKRKFLWLKLC